MIKNTNDFKKQRLERAKEFTKKLIKENKIIATLKIHGLQGIRYFKTKKDLNKYMKTTNEQLIKTKILKGEK